jgi:UDP-2-acetamido-3-amino-2,3-dideoxy-glucuronate N-acetyltransferase
VVGAGRWGRNHVRTLGELGVLGGVVEPDDAARAAIATAHPGLPVFRDLGEALDDGDFDGFTVATPAATHFRVAERILDHDKPVLVEKPLACSVDEARRLTQLAETRGVNLMVGHVMLFHPAIAKMKEQIEAGRIGKLQYLYSNRLNLGAVRTEENILWSFAPHDVSIFQSFVNAAPIQVESRGGAFLQPHLHDTTLTVLRYPENIVGHIFVSWLHPFKEHRLVVIGSKGMLSFEDSSVDKNLRFYEKSVDWVRGEPIPRDGPTEEVPYDRSMPLTAELRYFVERLDGRPIETCDGQSGVEVLEILERASRDLVVSGAVPPRHAEKGFFVHPSSFIDDDVTIGEGTRVWHFCNVQSGARIGRDCSIGQNVVVGNNAVIGNRVKIQNNVSLYEGVELEDYVFCGPSMVFTNVLDPRSKYPQKGSVHYHRTLVREGASLGANCTILCGHTIGRHAFVAAGAVVTRDVPNYALMMGVPAAQEGWVCECGETLPEFEARVSCPRCGLKYVLEKERLLAVEV